MVSTNAVDNAPPSGIESTDSLTDHSQSNEQSTEEALLAALTNNESGNHEKTESPATNDINNQDIVHSVERCVLEREHMLCSKELETLEAHESNIVNITTTAEMPTLTQSFEPLHTSTPFMKSSNDPLLFSVDAWAEDSTAAYPSSSEFVANGMTFASAFAANLEPSTLLYATAPSQPAQQHAPLAARPNLSDLRSGRRRSQSVPAPTPTPTFTRRLGNGRVQPIGTPQLPPAAYAANASPSAMQGHASAFSGPLRAAALPTHHLPPGVATEPASPARTGAKRALRREDAVEGGAGAGAAGDAKRRVRRRVESPTSAAPAHAAAADAWGLEPILENLRSLIARRVEEVRTQGGTQLEM